MSKIRSKSDFHLYKTWIGEIKFYEVLKLQALKIFFFIVFFRFEKWNLQKF